MWEHYLLVMKLITKLGAKCKVTGESRVCVHLPCLLLVQILMSKIQEKRERMKKYNLFLCIIIY